MSKHDPAANSDSSTQQDFGGLREKGPEAPSEEYAALIQFIREQKAHTGDEGEDDGSKIVRKRNWLMPWKVTEVRVNKHGDEEEQSQKVPASW